MRKLCLMLWFVALGAGAFTPHRGLWNNADEGGDGFNIDVQDGVLIVTVFSYKSNGDSEWYLASGPVTNGGRNFTGTLDKYRNGRCISCAWKPNTPSGSDGAISISFATETSGTVTLPGGRVTQITLFDFGYGSPPNGMLGQWLFTEEIISTFAERFDFAEILAPTTDGNGIAYDAGRRGGCEMQVRGSLAGTVLCVDLSSTGTVSNQYKFRYGLDETYDGSWISPSTSSLYPMKGFRIKSENGSSRRLGDEQAPVKTEPASRVSALPNPAEDAAFAAIANALRSVSR